MQRPSVGGGAGAHASEGTNLVLRGIAFIHKQSGECSGWVRCSIPWQLATSQVGLFVATSGKGPALNPCMERFEILDCLNSWRDSRPYVPDEARVSNPCACDITALLSL